MLSMHTAQARLTWFVESLRRRLRVRQSPHNHEWRGTGTHDLMAVLAHEATRLSDLLLVPERTDAPEVMVQCCDVAILSMVIADSMRALMGSADDAPSLDLVEEMKERCQRAVRRHIDAAGPVGEPSATLRYVLDEIAGF